MKCQKHTPTTIPITFADVHVEDYRILHLSHSENDDMNILHEKYLALCPGLRKYSNRPLHDVWRELLTEEEGKRFFVGFWNKSIPLIEDSQLRQYLEERYSW